MSPPVGPSPTNPPAMPRSDHSATPLDDLLATPREELLATLDELRATLGGDRR